MSAPVRQPKLRVLAGGAAARVGPTDEEIVSALQTHDPHIAGALYDRVLPAVDRALYRVFGRRELDHDDLIQATFEQIIRTIAGRRFAGACSLPTWASSIATHVALNALRSRRRERRVIDRTAGAAEPEPLAIATQVDGESRAAARVTVERVRRELAAMKPDRAEALFLHDVLGHELAEIAIITGVSVAAAQSRLVRGRKDFIERMRGSEDAP